MGVCVCAARNKMHGKRCWVIALATGIRQTQGVFATQFRHHYFIFILSVDVIHIISSHSHAVKLLDAHLYATLFFGPTWLKGEKKSLRVCGCESTYDVFV